jgi:hypothetical protein
MRLRPLLVGVAVCGTAAAGCGGRAADLPAAAAPAPAATHVTSAAVPPLSTAPGPCAVVVDRTLRTVAVRIDARAALRRRRPGSPPAIAGALTRRGDSPVCGATAAQTVADTVGAVGERLVHAEATGPEVQRALALVATDPAFVRAVRDRDPAGVRAAIVRFFRIHRLHIVRVRATTASGRLVNDVGGPFVLAPATRAVRARDGSVLGRVTLSIQDDAGFIKLMRRFTGAGVVLRTRSGGVPGSTRAPAAPPGRDGTISPGGRRDATFAFATRAFPGGPLSVSVLVPPTGS